MLVATPAAAMAAGENTAAGADVEDGDAGSICPPHANHHGDKRCICDRGFVCHHPDARFDRHCSAGYGDAAAAGATSTGARSGFRHRKCPGCTCKESAVAALHEKRDQSAATATVAAGQDTVDFNLESDDDAVVRCAERASRFKACLAGQRIETECISGADGAVRVDGVSHTHNRKTLSCGDQVRAVPPNEALICPAKAVAYVHIFKAGGTSITRAMRTVCPGSTVIYSRHTHERGMLESPHVEAIEAEPALPPDRAAGTAGHAADTVAEAAHGLWEDAVRRAFIADLSKGTLFRLFTIVREDLPARFKSGLHEVGLRGKNIVRLPNGTQPSVDDVAMAMKDAKRAGGVHVAEATMAIVVATTGSIATAGRRWRFNVINPTINSHLQPQWSFLGRLARGSRLHAYPGLHHIGVTSSMSTEIPVLFRHLFEAPLVNWELPHARSQAGAEAVWRKNRMHKKDPGLVVDGHALAIVHEIGNMSVADLSRKTTQAIQQFYSVDVACITHLDSPGQ